MDDAAATLSGDLGCASVPPAYASHPLVARRYFYTLPIELLEGIVEKVGEAEFNPELLGMERSLSQSCGDHAAQVGFRDGYPVRYDLLADPLSLQAAALDVAAGADELAWLREPGRKRSLVTLDVRLDWVADTCRGYAGWLAVNPTFAAEQDSLFVNWQKEVLKYGLPLVGTLGGPEQYVKAVLDFCARWHLIGLGGPFLPSPVRPQVPVPAGRQLATRPAPLGTTFFLPSVFPLPDRTQLRQMIEDAMGRHRAPEHLRQWADLAEADSQGKKAIARYARVFVLQHYWRVLFARHADALRRNVAKVRLAFAAFLFPMAGAHALHKAGETIRKDLALLAKARGHSNWFVQPSAFDRL